MDFGYPLPLAQLVTPSPGVLCDYLLRLPFAQLRHRPLRCYPLRRCVVEPLSGGQYAVAQLCRSDLLFPL